MSASIHYANMQALMLCYLLTDISILILAICFVLLNSQFVLQDFKYLQLNIWLVKQALWIIGHTLWKMLCMVRGQLLLSRYIHQICLKWQITLGMPLNRITMHSVHFMLDIMTSWPWNHVISRVVCLHAFPHDILRLTTPFNYGIKRVLIYVLIS